MVIQPRTAATLFAEMRSVSFEGRCLLDERRHCDDSGRRRALLGQIMAVQQRWDELFVRHSAAVTDEARAVWRAAKGAWRRA